MRSHMCRPCLVRWYCSPRKIPPLWSHAPSGASRGRFRVTGAELLLGGRRASSSGTQDPAHNQSYEHDGLRRRGYPTVVQQAKNNMQRFSHCIVLTRVGSFYELYFEHAEQVAPLLGLKLASKSTTMGPVPIAGFPFYQLDRYLKFLVQDHGKYVAISEEMPNDAVQKVKSGGLLFDRQVTRVITPGTLIDENFLNPFEHNYILAINTSADQPELGMGVDVPPARHFGLAWLDLSSGDFFTQTTNARDLSSAIARVGPREIVLNGQVRNDDRETRLDMINADDHVITYHQQSQDLDWAQELSALQGGKQARGSENDFTPVEELSAQLLIDYVKMQLPGTRLRLQAPIRRHSGEHMIIDRQSLRGLEIMKTMRDGVTKGSLLHSVNRTVTNSGSRLLAQRLSSPSMSTTVINDRLDLVEHLINDAGLLDRLVSLLRQTSDTLRLLQKLSFGRGSADDLLGLSQTISVTRQIATSLAKADHGPSDDASLKLHQAFEWDGPLEVARGIAEAIDEDKLQSKHQSEQSETAEAIEQVRSVLASQGTGEDSEALRKSGLGFSSVLKDRGPVSPALDEDRVDGELWIMRRTATPTLESLHSTLEGLAQERADLAEALQRQLGAKSLTLRFSPGLGHICHVKGKDTKMDLGKLNARIVSSSKSTSSFYLPAWTALGSRLEDAKARIRAEENQIFQSLRISVIDALIPLRRNASILDDLDVACSSAILALEKDLVRPILNHSTNTDIFGGRHVMVDTGLTSSGRSFTPNDCHLHASERLWIITGPNMAGKSTFLRQTALISILAQTGMYVPAAYAEMGLVDAIYSRVGAADNLAQEQSTFMVEMLETAAILRGATARSFVIMDEVGRGTTPEDGVAVGYAVLDHLRRVNGCRALFATHFHELADMTRDWEGVACYCTDVKESGSGAFRYDHRLHKGVNRESHALKVAQLAGLPDEALQTAREVLDRLRRAREDKHQ